MMRTSSRADSGFTLFELSIVLVILSALLGVYLKVGANRADESNARELNEKLDTIETALLNFRQVNGRLPCPADQTLDSSNTNFGVEGDTSPGDGSCTNTNLLKYPTVSSTIKAGAVPVRSLGLRDDLAIDPWGRKLMYVVELDATGNNAFSTYKTTNATFGTIYINDESGGVRTSRAVYVLWSAGKNGHGAYMANSGSRFSSSSTNTKELQNCACDSSASPKSPNLGDALASPAGVYFNQGSQTTSDYTDITKTFDDVVRYKTRGQLLSYDDTQ